jgi:hypothetical protein
MDKLRKRLQDDAADVEASVSPQLREGIDASLRAAERRNGPGERHPAAISRARAFRWSGGLLGVAAAAALVAVLNRPPADPQRLRPPETLPYTAKLPNPIPPQLRPAELTDPLQDELANLRADLRKVQKTVERDLGVTF